MIAAPVLGYFLKVKPAVESVDEMQTQIEAEYQEAARLNVAQAELDQAMAQAAVVENELNALKAQKIPLGAGNPWWRSVRQGTAFTPGGGTFRMGPRDQVVELADGMPAMFDLFFELREDLGPALRQYFDASGVAVSNFSLPAPEFNQSPSLMVPVAITPTSLTTSGVPGLRGEAQAASGSMTVQGKYEDVLKFLRRAGDAPRLLHIEGPISITAVPGTGGEEVYATMNMTVYLIPNLPPDQLAQLASLLGELDTSGAGAMGGMGGMGMMGPMMGPGMMGGM
jgi:hypothetical protein